MARTTESRGSLPAVEAFYDGLAADYDVMTDPGKRFVHEKPYLRLLVEQHGIRTALDAGCGTGFHTVALSRLGVSMTAVDVSEEMLSRLHARLDEEGIRATLLRKQFQDLPASLNGRFDAVFCMGNTLPHIPDREGVRRSLKRFHDVLKPGGHLFLQVLNYERILAAGEMVQNVREAGDSTFVRFSSTHGDSVTFSILTLKRSPAGLTPTLRSVELQPVLRQELIAILEETGFIGIGIHGSISLEHFNPVESKDLVIKCARGD